MKLEPHYAWIVAGLAALILYGSFYPFGFYSNPDPRGPLGTLLAHGFRLASRDDVLANVLLYLPLGFFAVYALDKWTLLAVGAVAVAALGLSLFVELAQFYDHGRVQDLSDICANTLGASLGAAAAIAARQRAFSPYVALLLACWVGNRCYPGSEAASATPLSLFRYFVAWLIAGLMMESLWGSSRTRIGLPLLLGGTLLVRALGAHLEPAEVAGGSAAVAIWSGVLWRLRSRATIAAALSVALVILLALAPFHFSTPARSFSWSPFRSFLLDQTTHAVPVFFEKAFLYGGLVWLLARAGFSFIAATLFGAALVFSLRLVQVYLPGRSAEITDTVLLLILATIMKLVAHAEARD